MTEQLVCARCAPLEARVAELEHALRSLTEENAELTLELQGAGQTRRTLERQLAKLRVDAARAREEDPTSEVVKTIVTHYKNALGKRIKVSASDSRAEVVRKALRHNPPEDLIEAIDGLALKPYVGPRGRTANPDGAKRHDRIGIAIGDQDAIERFRGYAQEAREAGEQDADWAWNNYLALNALAGMWASVTLDAAARRQKQIADAMIDEMREAA